MKVLHINYHSTRGGASRAMIRLHLGLRSISVDSRMLVREGEIDPADGARFQESVPEKERLPEQFLGHLLQGQGVDRHRTSISNTTFNLPFSGFDLSRHPEVLEADVINLHWPTYVLSARSLRGLLELGKPVFWTIHDQWAFTGGCHYSAGCTKYEQACASCPQLTGDFTRLPSAVMKEKKRQLAGHQIHIVGPSRWIADCARRSSLLRAQSISSIPNGIEHDIFCPRPKAEARRLLGLPEDHLVLLFGADHLVEIRKGWRYLREALELTVRQLSRNLPICLAFFGETPEELETLPIPLFSLGYIHDDERLTAAYSAADLFILPSLEDNQPNTVMEAMACGTPVAAFSVGALPDIVTNNENGYLVPVGDAGQLGEAIIRFALSPEDRHRLSSAARRWIEENGTIEAQARAYRELYERALKNASPQTQENRVPDTCCPYQSASRSLHQDHHVLRPLGQVLKADTPTAPVFRPGWSFGRLKEKRRVQHYLNTWLTSLPAVQRNYLTDVHGIYSHDEISLQSGFKFPEGPYPEMNLPWSFVWSELPEAQLTVTSPLKKESRLIAEFQSPTPGLEISAETCSGQRSSIAASANLGNPQLTRTSIHLDLPVSTRPIVVKFMFHVPDEIELNNDLALAFFKLKIHRR